MKRRNTLPRRSFLKTAAPLAGAFAGALRGIDLRAATLPDIDYAESRYVDVWLRHPVLGDPSFDAFERVPGNPIHTGDLPYGWPVNGFFFPDPVSGNCYLYIGDYATGYVGPPPSRCILYRSKDRGDAWENLGVVLHGDAQMFDKDGCTPDVSVVYADGRYHMVYDWGTLNYNKDGGLAYAWADKPEGPWHRDAQAITRNSTLTPLLNKYQRTYAATLLRRRQDWLILAMMDSAPHSWALFAMTAPQPQGPYSERTLVRNVESGYFHPPLMEFYPAFADGGWVYAPRPRWPAIATFRSSSALLWRTPLIPRLGRFIAMDRCGTAKTFLTKLMESGARRFRDGWMRKGACECYSRRAMKPALEPSTWPRDRGRNLCGSGAFTSAATAHQASTLLRRNYADFTLNASLRVRGTARILWSYQAPLGPDKPTSDAALHPLAMTRHQGIELGPKGWRILTADTQGNLAVRASGSVPHEDGWQITLRREASGALTLALGVDGLQVWSGMTTPGCGAVGLWVDSHSHLSVDRFAIEGEAQAGTISFLYTEGLLGAGESHKNWIERKDASFRFGLGALGPDGGGRVKWNFMGSGFALWSPKGPDYGTAEVVLDDAKIATVDLHAAQTQPSRPVFRKTGLADTFHAVALQSIKGRLVVDSLETISE